jgi:hypothetical protein
VPEAFCPLPGALDLPGWPLESRDPTGCQEAGPGLLEPVGCDPAAGGVGEELALLGLVVGAGVPGACGAPGLAGLGALAAAGWAFSAAVGLGVFAPALDDGGGGKSAIGIAD